MKAIQTAQRLNALPEYVFSRLSKRVAEVEKETKRKVLNLGPGSPDVRPSTIHLNKLKEYIEEPGSHLYPGYQAIPELAGALIQWYRTRFQVSLEASELLPLLGAKDGVSHLPFALLNNGDCFLVPNPGYPAYVSPTLMMDVSPIPYDLFPQDDFRISVKNLEGQVTPKTKFMWVNFPSNPTGQVATLAELKSIIDFGREHDLIIVYDNAYSEITFNGFVAPSILQVEGAKDIAVELGSFSKTFSLAGFRMGWMVGNQEIISALAKVKAQVDSGLSLPLQKLGAFALSHPDDEWHAQMLSSYRERRDVIAAKLRKIGLTFTLPRGALYIWAKIPDSASGSEDFCMQLLEEKQVLLTPGSAFGSNGERFVRVSICSNIEAIDEYL
jgi:LL-diaminopimelate aminotransferase